jgi:hypothetical protein
MSYPRHTVLELGKEGIACTIKEAGNFFSNGWTWRASS